MPSGGLETPPLSMHGPKKPYKQNIRSSFLVEQWLNVSTTETVVECFTCMAFDQVSWSKHSTTKGLSLRASGGLEAPGPHHASGGGGAPPREPARRRRAPPRPIAGRCAPVRAVAPCRAQQRAAASRCAQRYTLRAVSARCCTPLHAAARRCRLLHPTARRCAPLRAGARSGTRCAPVLAVARCCAPLRAVARRRAPLHARAALRGRGRGFGSGPWRVGDAELCVVFSTGWLLRSHPKRGFRRSGPGQVT